MSETPKYDLWVGVKQAASNLVRQMQSLDENVKVKGAVSSSVYYGLNTDEFLELTTDFTDIEKELGNVLKFATMAASWIELKKEENDG